MEGSRLTPEMVGVYTQRGLWSHRLLHDYLWQYAEERPEHTAVVGPARGGAGQVRLCYKALRGEVEELARALVALELGPGDIVSVQLPNWYEFLVATLAVSRIGAVLNGVTPVYRQHELRFILGRTASKVFIIPSRFRDFDYVEMISELRSDLPALRHIVVVDERAPREMLSFDQLLGLGRDGALSKVSPGPGSANDLVQVAFTSGTTGEPKGVMHTHNTLLATVRAVIDHIGIRPEQVNLVISPVGHQTGFLWGLLVTLMTGGTCIFQDRWDPAVAVEMISREGVTTIAGATPFLRDLTYAPNLAPEKVKTLHTFITAGAPIPSVVAQDAVTRLGCKVHSAWGMTEYGIGTAVGEGDPEEKAATSDGRPVPGAEIRVVDEQGRPAAPSQEGDLQIRGPGLFAGYYKRPDLTENSFSPDGFLRTGDRAREDREGFIRLMGRTKDIIIRGGEKISVAEIEEMLYAHPKIKDVAIVAMPHERLGEQACAFVVLKGEVGGLNLGELTDFLLRKQIAKQKLPERLQVIPELPRTVTGKVQKFKLREEIARKVRED